MIIIMAGLVCSTSNVSVSKCQYLRRVEHWCHFVSLFVTFCGETEIVSTYVIKTSGHCFCGSVTAV
jgi:hypothetical protein